MTNASRLTLIPVERLRQRGLTARVIAAVGGVNPTSAQRWLHGSRPRGPALARLRRAARMATAWPEGATSFSRWMSTPSPALSAQSPVQWISADGADLPLAECWREATGASEAALTRAFPDLRAGGTTAGGDATLLIVERALRDFEAPPVQGTLASVTQAMAAGAVPAYSRVFEKQAATMAAGLRGRIFASLTDSSLAVTQQHAASVAGLAGQALAPPALEALARAVGPWRAAGLEVFETMEPYRRLGDHFQSHVQRVGGLPQPGLGFQHDAISRLFASVGPSPAALASLSLAVDGSLMAAVGATLDAQTRLVQPFARESAAWRSWLPRFPRALEMTEGADPDSMSAKAHVLTRTAIAACAPDPATRDDREWVNEALEKSRRLSFDLDLIVPGTDYRLHDALQACDPRALSAFRGAMDAIAWRRPDAARHAAVSMREAVKSISRALTPALPANTPSRERLRAAVGSALTDADQKTMVAAQIELLLTVTGPTSAAVHGRNDDVSVQEVLLKGVLSALCSLISAWAMSGGVAYVRNNEARETESGTRFELLNPVPPD